MYYIGHKKPKITFFPVSLVSYVQQLTVFFLARALETPVLFNANVMIYFLFYLVVSNEKCEAHLKIWKIQNSDMNVCLI